MEYGRKKLKLEANLEQCFSTWVENTLPKESEMSHETSLLYKAARQYMQLVVDREQKAYKYELATPNEHMRDWARVAGMEIFKWQEEREVKVPGLPVGWIFETIIVPSQEKSA